MDNSAVPPSTNPVVQIYGSLKKEQDQTFEDLKNKEEEWVNFYKSGFFFLVKEYIDNLLNSLENLEGQAWENGASSDEIVMRRAVMRLTKSNLLSLVNKVEQTRTVRSNTGGAKTESSLS